MTFEEAIRKSMKSYYKNLGPDALRGTPSSGKSKTRYDKKYFDSVGEEYGVEPVKLDKKSFKPSSKSGDKKKGY